MANPPLLAVEGLSVDIALGHGVLHALRDVNLTVGSGETVGLVGESGSGKSMTALAVMGLLPVQARRSARTLALDGHDLLALSDRDLARQVRGNRIGMIFQEPMTSLNPVYTIARQLTETMLLHRGGAYREAEDRAVFLLEKVGLTGARGRLNHYPHQLSGGQRQRVMIAMALMNEPRLLIADEPTTALDVTIQAQTLRLLVELRRELGMSMMLITHDLGIVARAADRVAVMYAGQVVETGSVSEVFSDPRHPYTQGLLACVPRPGGIKAGGRLGSIPGIVPSLMGELRGCAFAERCPRAASDCRQTPPPVRSGGAQRTWRCAEPPPPAHAQTPVGSTPDAGAIARPEPSEYGAIMRARGVHCTFSMRSSLFGRPRSVRAVDGVDLDVRRGEVLALVGESGCGKTTLARVLLGLQDFGGGKVMIEDAEIGNVPRVRLTRRIQPVFQDPYSSLNPRRTIGEIVQRPLELHGIGEPVERRRAVEEVMEKVGLPRRLYHRYPGQLSGGQRQRVAIARAIVMKPEIVVCDEPTSALDASVQAQILNLLLDLREEFALTYLIITHDLTLVEHLATRVAVMYLGQIVEVGGRGEVFSRPRHPYTRALLESVLTPVPGVGIPDTGLGHDYPNPLDPPPGCRFHPRCPFAAASCKVNAPRLEAAAGHGVRCLRAEELAPWMTR